MRTAWMIVVLLAAGFASAQESPSLGSDAASPAADPGVRDDDTLLTASKLRGRVQEMRRQVLGGGPAVEKSEKEALRFYRRKIDELAQRTDELRITRDLKQTEYDLALDTTLNPRDDDERARAARTAGKLRDDMAEIDVEIRRLEQQGDALGQGVAAIQKRAERRKTLLSRLQGPEFTEEVPYLTDELVDFVDDEEQDQSDPFLDEGFIEDLLKRDPEKGRELLFRHDPARYWQRFPFVPPYRTLGRALRFPAPDLPTRR